MNKIGNNHSSLFDKVAFSKQEPSNNLSDQIMAALKAKRGEKSLKEIFAQLQDHLEPNPGAVGGPDAGLNGPLPDASPELGGGELGGETPSVDTEGAKKSLVEALIALCGGPEEAKSCIDTLGAGGVEEAGLGDGMDDIGGDIPAPADDVPGLPAGELDSASPMPMPPTM